MLDPAHARGLSGGPTPADLARRASHPLLLSSQAALPYYFLGYSPKQIKGAYGIPSTVTGAGVTIAIVDWHDDPKAGADFDVFSRQFGLPTILGRCGCFKKVNQTGGTKKYPATGTTKEIGEISLDIEWAHAIAPGAHILLIEATDGTLANLMIAEDYATAHAQVVSNSWGVLNGEFSGETAFDSYFNKPVAITASTGDMGAPTQYPAASPYVLAVGGTNLSITGRTWFGGCGKSGCGYGGESVWSGSGGGPSQYEPQPAYQTGYCGSTVNVNACINTLDQQTRGTPDVTWVGSGTPGVAIYDSFASLFDKGWTTTGGTSVGAPSVAGLIALADQANHTVLTTNDLGSRFAYQNAGNGATYGTTYEDVISGSDGSPCCHAGKDFDLASGLGSPIGSQWIQAVTQPVTLSSPSLQAVAAVSASDVWAVGYTTGTVSQTLIEHWDGTAWSVVPSPNVGSGNNFLYGAAAVSASDVWAVGFGQNSPTSTYQTLIEHWDGSHWSVVPSPNAGLADNQLYSLTVVSASDVWVVGAYHEYQTLIEHWDGTAWSVVPSPNVGSGNNFLYGAAAVSASDVWAVGSEYDITVGMWQTLIEHWDGTQWSVVPSPSIGPAHNEFYGAAAISASDVWAVGYVNNGQTLTEHWDGTQWSVVPSPNPGAGNFLLGVTTVSTSDVWAVGWLLNNAGFDQTVIEHWDGTHWSIVPSPNGGGDSHLTGAAEVSASDVWAVGFVYSPEYGGVYQTLIEHWDGTVWSVVPSP
jgi:hypothetical protein